MGKIQKEKKKPNIAVHSAYDFYLILEILYVLNLRENTAECEAEAMHGTIIKYENSVHSDLS